MPHSVHMLAFRVGEKLHGVSLRVVRTALQAVEVTPVPGAPPGVRGVIDVHGQVVPVVDMRLKVGLPAAPPAVSDRLVLLEVASGPLALLVDAIHGVVEVPPEAITPPAEVGPNLEHVEGIVRLPDGLLIVLDAERYFEAEQAVRRRDAGGAATISGAEGV